MSNQYLKLRRSAVQGRIPTTSSLDFGELALNTYDGLVFMRKSSSLGDTVISIGSTSPGGSNGQIQYNNSGSFGGISTFSYLNNTLIITGSVISSGSFKQIGSLTLTGSFGVSGSTLQVGNNTLFGNTLLSGSITISGSSGPGSATASIQIYGDIRQSGYHRFDPVSTNINTSISASYIYVSGSTNDLYFSQNGDGYSNVTRLRWLEGNLYTGLLHGGFITTQSSTVYQISSGSGLVVNLNASIGANPYPAITYVNWPNISSSIAALSASYDQQFVSVLSNGTIFAQGIPYSDGDFNTKIPIGIVIHQNHSTINAVQTFPGVGYGWKQRSYDFIRAFGPLKISGYSLSPSGSSTGSLLLSGGTSWVDGRNYTVDPNNPSYITEAVGIANSKIYRYYQSGSEWNYNTNNGIGYTTIDPSKYSNNGTLTSVSNNHWTIQRVFYFPNSATKALYIYYGNAEYANQTDALAAINTEAFSEAPNTAANAIYVGYMLLRHNANFTTAASYAMYQAGLFRAGGTGGAGGGGGGVTTLAGLTDVALSSPTDYQSLVYNAASSKWINSSFISASISGTSSYANTSSYALNGGVTQIFAGSNISISPTNGLGQVTISSTGGGGSNYNTSTGSYGSFYDTTTQTNPVINIPRSMSLNTTDISNGVSISGSTNPFNTYIKFTNAGIYDIQFSAQFDRIAGSGNATFTPTIWLVYTGSNVANSATDILVTGGAGTSAIVPAWNWVIPIAANDYVEIYWSTPSTEVGLKSSVSRSNPTRPAVPSVIATVTQVA
jgi:hypothetical protein